MRRFVIPRRRVLAARRRLWSPPAHWWLLAFCLAVVMILIGFEGFVTHTIGTTDEPHSAANAAAPLVGNRALLTVRDGRLRTAQPAPRMRIALTFDDGPDPTWTPRIAAVLRRQHVPGAFFVVGSEAARHPDLIRMLARSGHELGNHTFTHAALTNGAGWMRRTQLDLTEAVLVGLTGHFSRLVRPPYSATPDAVTRAQERKLVEAAGNRYVIALADLDSKDWQRRGVTKTVASATPHAGRGGIVMFHDGGGNRSQTVAALTVLIPRLEARGYRFVSLAQLAGVPEAVMSPPASLAERRRGELFTWSVRFAFLLVGLLRWLVLGVGILVTTRVGAAVHPGQPPHAADAPGRAGRRLHPRRLGRGPRL